MYRYLTVNVKLWVVDVCTVVYSLHFLNVGHWCGVLKFNRPFRFSLKFLAFKFSILLQVQNLMYPAEIYNVTVCKTVKRMSF